MTSRRLASRSVERRVWGWKSNRYELRWSFSITINEDLHAGPKNTLTWWRMRRNRFGHFEWICRRAFSPSLTMCFSNFWCASVCFSGVERQMQLRVWMSKAFSDTFREVFKVGTILCWYCSSSLRFFFAPFATCIFCARDLIGCGQDADTFGFS